MLLQNISITNIYTNFFPGVCKCFLSRLCFYELCVFIFWSRLFTFASMFFLVWIILCLESLLFCANFISQMSQAYGFSPVCIFVCLLRSLEDINFLQQILHVNGFSPVWIILCLERMLDFVNPFSQTSHL